MQYGYNQQQLYPTVEVYHDAIPYMAGVSMRDFFLDKQKCVYAWKEGTAALQDYFGELFPMRKPSLPPISYGHLISIGAPVFFPEHGEPNISPFAGCIDEAIDILKERKGADFTNAPMFQHYLELWDFMKGEFPGMPFSGFGDQGPLTSAILMRGQDFLLDIYDEPEKSKEFLTLITDSTIGFTKQLRRINNQPEMLESAGMVDDFASLIPPSMWDEFVIPFWEQRFNALFTGTRRGIHVENLMPAHLKYMKTAKATHFQPSVSDMITLDTVKTHLDPGITVDWLLYSYHITDMSDAEIQRWVDEVVEAGICVIRTQFGAYACQANKLDRIFAFFAAFEKYGCKC